METPDETLEYRVPCHGVGDTGPGPRVRQGPWSKDDGKFSSRINQIVRQAEKVPGPGKYVAHADWAAKGGSAFAKGERTYKPCNKVPSPDTYERKDFMDKPCLGCKEVLSKNPRVPFGKIPQGKRRSFLDQAIARSGQVPGPGFVDKRSTSCDRLDPSIKGVTSWTRESAHTPSKKQPEKTLAPDHYNVDFKLTQERRPMYTVPKEIAANFLDRAVKEKWIDAKSKKELPGPGAYNTSDFNINRLSRGTYHLQLRGLSRSAMSGYF